MVANAYSRQSTRHGGAAVILRNDVPFKVLNDIKNLSVDRVIEMTAIRVAKHKLIVVAIYRPPSGDFETFMSIVDEALELCLRRYPTDNFVFAGDYNIDFRVQSSERSKTVELFTSYNMSYMFSDPSRETKNSSSCIDNMFSNMCCGNFDTRTYDPHLSDHFAQILKIELSHCEPEKNTYRIVSQINEKNTNQFIQAAGREDWTLVYH